MNCRCPFHGIDYDDDISPKCPACVRGGVTVITCAPDEVDAVRAAVKGMDTAADEVGAFAVVYYRGYVLANALPDPVGGCYTLAQIAAHVERRKVEAQHAADKLAEQDRRNAAEGRK